MNQKPEALRLAEIIGGNCAAELRRLHAANADLLAALQEIVDAADGDGWNQLDASFSKARSAIAKATGETK